ncbi:hypothetical protein HBB16_06250 [Pseudonocardia sp. MCCB 268]|nr:hypothetical protein [Pseudonocardia cytotoxica]
MTPRSRRWFTAPGAAPAVGGQAERAASAPAPGWPPSVPRRRFGRVGVSTEVPEIDDELVEEIDPSTPPYGTDLPRCAGSRTPPVAREPVRSRPGGGRHRGASSPRTPAVAYDHGPDDTGSLYRAGGGADPESGTAVAAPAAADDDLTAGRSTCRPVSGPLWIPMRPA